MSMLQNITHILAIRHGETRWNVDGRLQGQLDIELNERGLRQAQQLANALKDHPLDALYSSDLMRAMQTAQPIAHALQRPVQTLAGLRERHFGYYQGKTFLQVQAMAPDDAQRWQQRDPDFVPGESGESLHVFQARILQTLSDIVQKHEGQTIAIITHGGVLDTLYRNATHQDIRAPRTWQLGNASISRLLWSPEGLSMVRWADASHLDDDSLAPHGEPTDVEPCDQGAKNA